MSLGVKSLWRAQTWSVCIKELSLVPVPREQQHHDKFRRWMSLSAPNPSSRGSGQDQIGNETKTDNNAPEDENFHQEEEEPTSSSSSSLPPPPLTTRALLKQAIKREPNPESLRKPAGLALVKPPAQYPSKYETERSLRKHVKSTDRQHLHDLFSRAYDKPDDNWRSTMDFMLRHTPSFEEMFNLKVVIGRGAAQEARRMLSGLDNNIGQIERRNQSVIRFEESFPDDETLVLNVAGTETAVRDSLRDIIKASGQLTAVRIMDDDWKEKLGDIWDGSGTDETLRLYSGGEVLAGDTTMTVQNDSASHSGGSAQSKRHQHYVLTKRADDITPPAEWTKLSFQKYISSLVYGILPTHLFRQLYKEGPSHQETVVSLLIDAFTSEDTQSAVSVSALKMALTYIHSKGPVFRPAARQIFTQAESLQLALDAETFGIFLASASRAREINNFNSILRLMVRKRFHLQSHAWYAFLEMIEHASVKRYVVGRMQASGLHRIPTFAVGIGRQLAPVYLESALEKKKKAEEGTAAAVCDIDIGAFVRSHDAQYGKEWLNTTTLNKLLDLLGKHGQLDACRALLDLVHTHGRRANPDAYTLNTMITHSRRIPDHIALLQSMRARWPWVRPDAVTYHQLLSIARKTRLPNMVRVLFRYAVHDRLLGAKARHQLSTLLRDGERNFSNRRFLLKAWEDAIFGKAELEAVRGRLHPDTKNVVTVTAYDLEERHVAQAKGMKPSVDIATKLREAYDRDLEIHRLVKEGMVLTPAMRDALTVDIPLQTPGEAEALPLSAP